MKFLFSNDPKIPIKEITHPNEGINLLVICSFKFLISILCLTVNMPAGVFGPLFCIGALSGRLYGHVLKYFFTVSDENIYIAKQKEDSKPIELSDQLFGKRKKKINLFQDTYIYFSIPIFNKSRNLAWIKTGIACGKTCGEGRTLILQKINGKWKIINKKSNWII